MTDLTILGGGPAGVGVAFYAQRAGVPFTLFEKSAELGGMCRTLRHGEHLYDCGAHRFHDQDGDITRDVLELMGDEMLAVDAPSMIWDRGRFVDFPPTPLNAILACGPIEVWRIGVELLRAYLRPRECASFEDFAISQFGETLARRIALNYSEKLWGLPAARLSPNIATRRLKGMTLRSLFFELILPGKKTSHIDGAFLYPRRGYGRIVQNLESTLPPDSIRLAHEIVRIQCERGKIARILFAGGHVVEPRGRVVSTLPLTVLVKFLGEQISAEARQAAARLRFRQIRLFFLRLKRPQLSANASIYIPDPQFCISRLYEPKNRSAALAPPGETSVVVEVPCFPDDPIQRMPNEDLAERVITELVALKLVDRAEVVEWKHHFLANAYPVYSLDYSNEIRIITEELARISNLSTIGRAGLFLYSHLHDQLRLAKDYVAAHLQSRYEVGLERALEPSTQPADRPTTTNREEGASLQRASLRVLAKRLIGTFHRARLDAAEQAWVRSLLTREEFDLWLKLSPHDQRHSVRVAQAVRRRLAATQYAGDLRWLSVAIMHDIGKLESNLAMHERMLAAAAGRIVKLSTARRWATSARGLTRRVGKYLIHGALGSEMILSAGGREETALWSSVHQGDGLAAEAMIPLPVIKALVDADSY